MKFLIIFTLLCVQVSQVVPGGPGQTDPSSSGICPSHENFESQFQDILNEMTGGEVMTQLSHEDNLTTRNEEIYDTIDELKKWIDSVKPPKEFLEKYLTRFRLLYEAAKLFADWCDELKELLDQLAEIIHYIENLIKELGDL